MVIELLGVGVADGNGRWLVRRACAEMTGGQVTAVVSRWPEERAAVLDAASGRRIPVEGRVWVERVPLMGETAGRIRALVPQARGDAPGRAAVRHVECPCRARPLRQPRAAAPTRRRGGGGPCGLIIRDLDGPLSPGEGRALMSVARTLSGTHRLAVLVGLGDPALAHAGADRVLGIDAGRLVYEGPPVRAAGAACVAGTCA